MVTIFFYRIFGPSHRGVAALAVVFNVAGLGLEAAQWSIHGIDVAVVLHGAYCLAMGYLVLRSGLVPRLIGLLMMAASFGWATYLSPAVAQQLSPYNLILGIAGEALACLWLALHGTRARTAASLGSIRT